LKVALSGSEVIVGSANGSLPESSLVLGLGLPGVGDQALRGAFRLVLVLGSSFIVASALMFVIDKRRKIGDIHHQMLGMFCYRKIFNGCRNRLANEFRLCSHK